MRNLLKNKLIIIFSIFLLIFVSFTGTVSANFDFSYNEADYSLPDLPEGYSNFILRKYPQEDIITFFGFNEDKFEDCLRCVENSSGYYYSSSVAFSVYYYYPSKGTWDFQNTSSVSISLDTIVYSTIDLKDTEGNVVFQVAPQEIVQVELMKATQIQELLPQMIAVVKMILPVCLLIFGMLLLVFLIKSKNLLHL